MTLSILSVIGFIIYIIGLLVGLLLVPLGLPGTWIIVLTAVSYGALTDFQTRTSDLWVVGTVMALAVVGEILEFGIGIVASKKLKVSNGAIVASVIGGLVGGMVGTPVFLIGPLIGLLVGVFLGAFLFELFVQKKILSAFKAALGAFFSRITALFVKTMIALAMVIYLLMKTF